MCVCVFSRTGVPNSVAAVGVHPEKAPSLVRHKSNLSDHVWTIDSTLSPCLSGRGSSFRRNAALWRHHRTTRTPRQSKKLGSPNAAFTPFRQVKHLVNNHKHIEESEERGVSLIEFLSTFTVFSKLETSIAQSKISGRYSISKGKEVRVRALRSRISALDISRPRFHPPQYVKRRTTLHESRTQT